MSTTTPTTTTTTEPASASALREVTTNARVVEDAPERVIILKEETRPMTTEKREREEDDEAVGTVEAAPVATKRGKGGRQVETAPREMSIELPETLAEWKTGAEEQLKHLWTLQRQRLLDWFETKAGINICIVSCPAEGIRLKLRDMRENGVYGSSMVPYLQIMREIFDTADEYVDDLDEEIDFDDFWDEDEEEEDEDEDEDDDEEEEEEIPIVARARVEEAPQAETREEPEPQARSRGASRSAPSAEERAAMQVKFRQFSLFLGQYFSEKRLEKEDILALLEHAANNNFDDESEVMRFLDFLQGQNKIMIDQDDQSVYII
jgi:hypothetical protein